MEPETLEPLESWDALEQRVAQEQLDLWAEPVPKVPLVPKVKQATLGPTVKLEPLVSLVHKVQLV